MGPDWEKHFVEQNHGSNSGTGIENNTNLGTSGHSFISVLHSASETCYGDQNAVWFALDTGYFYRAKSSIGSSQPLSSSYFEAISPAAIHTACPGMLGYIGMRNVGSYRLGRLQKLVC